MVSRKPMQLRRLSARLGLWQACAIAALFASPAVASAQEGDPETISEPVVQEIPQNTAGSHELNNALVRLSRNPRDVDALIDAGNAAALLRDFSASAGFFTRASQIDPANGRVKAGMGSALVRNENPFDALTLFAEAVQLGVAESVIAADRGLAFDLVGDPVTAQHNYQIALARSPSDEVTLRYALSLAISGNRRAADQQLVPLLRQQDPAAWRTRAFIFAINGEAEEAVAIAYATMPRELAEGVAPYLRYMTRLTRAQQAAASNFGHFPRAAQIGREDPRAAQHALNTPPAARGGADAGLVPSGEPLGNRRSRNRDREVATAATDSGGRQRGAPRASRAPRRRPGDGAATVTAASPVVTNAVAAPAPAAVPAATVTAPTPPAPLPASPAQAVETASAQAAASPAVQEPSLIASAVDVATTPRPAPAPTTTPTSTLAPAPGPVPVETDMVVAQLANQAAIQPVPAPAQSAAPTEAQSAPVLVADSFNLAQLAAPSTQAADVISTSPAASGGEVLAPSQEAAPAPVTLAAAAATREAPTATASVPASPVPSIDLDSMFADYTPPAEEQQRSVAAVDITRITPARPRPPEPPAAVAARPAAPAPAAAASANGRVRGRANAATTAATPAVPATRGTRGAAIGPAAHPSRVWVQLAFGPDRTAMPGEWRQITRDAAEAMRGKRGFLTSWRNNFRLLTGPFESEAAARSFLATLGRSNVDGIVWTSAVGQVVDNLPAR